MCDHDTTVEELKQRLDRGEDGFILDVPNPKEIQICRLDRPREIIHCKCGMGGQRAIQFLPQQRFTRLRNLTRGILAWADRIDRTMLKY